MTTAARIRSLRDALGMTQAQVAAASGGAIDQPAVAKVESGKNKATSHEVRAGLARAFGVSIATLDAFLKDELPLERVVALSAPSEAGSSALDSRVVHEPAEPAPGDDETPLESALLRVTHRHPAEFGLRDLDLAREVVRKTNRYVEDGADLESIALNLLRATKQERLNEARPSVLGVVSRWALGKLDATQHAAAEARAATKTSEWREAAEQKGYGKPEDFPNVLPKPTKK